MGTTVESTAVVAGRGRWTRRALGLSDAAARAALRNASVAPEDVDLLLNTGIYHDRNLGEPALASLIQEDVGANLGNPPLRGHGTFSFDVANGSAGVVTALQIADGLLVSGTAKHVLIVAGDADPGHGLTRRFPFAPVAGALLCGRDDSVDGFVHFASASFPKLGPWTSRVGFTHGRNRLEFDISPMFDSLAAGYAADVAAKLLADEGLDTTEVDAVAASPARAEFRAALAANLAIPDERVTVGDVPGAHTAAPVVALDAVRARHGVRSVLLVAAAAGTVAAALYRT